MKTLFDKTQVNAMKLNNRFVRSATWERMANDSGHMNERLMGVYEKLAHGGVGLIITGYAFVLPEEQPNPKMMGIYDDSFIADYKPLTEMVHQHNSKIVLQIAYGGTSTSYNVGGRVIWGPSQVTHPRSKVPATPMTEADIQVLVGAFAQAGLRAKKAGFDGVQFHGAHGYLLSQFLSSHFNRRQDDYGGSIDNKARIIMEVYDATRALVGEDFNIMIKINASDFAEQGFTFEECKHVCRALDERGINAIEISGGKALNPTEESSYSIYAAEVAQEIEAPVIVVGMNRSLEVMEEILNKTSIEYFSLCRPFIREPELVNRWSKGDVRRAACISCGKCYSSDGIRCIFTV